MWVAVCNCVAVADNSSRVYFGCGGPVRSGPSLPRRLAWLGVAWRCRGCGGGRGWLSWAGPLACCAWSVWRSLRSRGSGRVNEGAQLGLVRHGPPHAISVDCMLTPGTKKNGGMRDWMTNKSY